VWDRFHAPAGEQGWYYAEVARILTAKHPSVLTRELRRVVDELAETIDGR
jgi:hypothetical protein